MHFFFIFGSSKDDTEAGVVHFWEFDFVFVEVIRSCRHSVVFADVVEEDDSADSDEWTVER